MDRERVPQRVRREVLGQFGRVQDARRAGAPARVFRIEQTSRLWRI
jgi:hypothetical protein